MSTVKFRKVPELFPNRKVRTVRTEQLCRLLKLIGYNTQNFIHRATAVHFERSKYTVDNHQQGSQKYLLPE